MTTPQDVQAQAAPLLAPVADGKPGGDNASYDPEYEAVRNEVGKLDSPTGGEIDWELVARESRDILVGKSKDILIASYYAYAMFETGKLPGLAVGVAVLEGMLEQYWETMFPPLKRARGRGNALGWLTARLEIALPALALSPADRPALDVVIAGFRTMSGVARDKLEDNAPATRGVSDALERLNLKIPKAAAPAPAPPAPAPAPPAPVAASEPTPPAPVPPAPVAAEPSPPAAAAVPAAAAPTTAAPAAAAPAAAPAPAAPPEPAKKDWLAEAQEAAKPWLESLGDAPHGIDARYEPDYESIRTEVGKLDSPSDDTDVQWEEVGRLASELLKTKTKDLLVGAYLAYARLQTHGIEGLGVGLCVVTGLLENFSDVWPSRARGRGNALSWLTEQLERQLASFKPEPKHREAVEGLTKIVRTFGLAAREKLEDNAPSTRPLEERLQRMLLAIPKAAPPPPPKPATPPPAATPTPAAAATPAPAAASAPAAAASAPPMPAATADVGSAEEVSKYLLETGRAMVKAANLLRRAQLSSPGAYRLMRVGVWLHLDKAPPAGAGGKTQIPPIPPARRQQLALMEQNSKWAALLEESESAMMQFRFSLDLQRLSSMSLQRLGAEYEPARQVLLGEVAAVLRRMPELPDLVFADGSPLADEQTRAWIGSDVAAGEGGGGGGGGRSDDPGEPFGKIATLLKSGKAPEALKLAKESIDGTGPARLRYIRRLSLAQACLEAGEAKLARSMYAALDREMTERGLTEWEPGLATQCLEGLVRAIRAAAQKGSQYPRADAVFERLCHVDPMVAGRFGG